MKFRSEEEIKSYIMSRIKNSVAMSEKKAHEIINNFLKQYYSEFSPSVYERTYQRLHSLVKSEVASTGNGYKAEIYFDISKLDYSMKLVNGKQVPNKGWSEEKTLEAAMTGSHGGYSFGTPIWTESETMLNANMINILKQYLISSGIPIR